MTWVTEQQELEQSQGEEVLLLQRKHSLGVGMYQIVGNEYDCSVPQSFPLIICTSLIGNRRGGGEEQWRRLSPTILHRMILST